MHGTPTTVTPCHVFSRANARSTLSLASTTCCHTIATIPRTTCAWLHQLATTQLPSMASLASYTPPVPRVNCQPPLPPPQHAPLPVPPAALSTLPCFVLTIVSHLAFAAGLHVHAYLRPWPGAKLR